MNKILQLIDQTTMYRVVLYVLLVYVVAAFGLSSTGYLFYTFEELILSLIVIVAVSTIVHFMCKTLWSAPANYESTLISALIVFLIFDPKSSVQGLLSLALVSSVMVLVKYVLAYRNMHIANPVILASVFVALFGFAYATWWVGNYAMAALVFLGGLIITHKIRRFAMVLTTVFVALVVYSAVALFRGDLSFQYIQTFFLAWPILFLATVMVTEPLSTPAGTHKQVLYGALVGALSSIPYKFGPIYSSPEMALLVANLAFYPTTLKARVELVVQDVRTVARDTYEIVLKAGTAIHYQAGQYLEWTIPHQSDKRGIRRYFTIASSPTEHNIKLGLKYNPDQSSSYKQELIEGGKGTVLYATSLDGDFTLPYDTTRPVVMIAGGIGVTPFRSMVKYLVDTKQKRKITLIYCNNTQEDIAYQDIWQEAVDCSQLDFTHIDVLSKPQDGWPGYTGYISEKVFKQEDIDMESSVFYISGPPVMVNATKRILIKQGVSRNSIVTDYFPGLA